MAKTLKDLEALKNKQLTDRAAKIVNCIEQLFWETGSTPVYENVAVLTNETVAYVKATVERNFTARRALAARGVDLDPDKSAKLLTSEQLMCVNLVMNSHDARSLREKLDFAGVSSQKWQAWLRQPGFSQYITKRAEEAFGANDYAAYEALRANIEDGDLNAVKFHFEMRGKYKQSIDVNINVEQVITRVVEIIATHVKDPEIIMAIAEDLEGLELSEGNVLAVDLPALSGVHGF